MIDVFNFESTVSCEICRILFLRYCIKNSKDGTFINGVSRLMYGDVEALKNNIYRPPIFGALIHFSLDTQVSLELLLFE